MTGKLWGKNQDDLDAERQEMRAYADLAEQQNATPEQLGRHYGNKLQPVSIRHVEGSTIRDCYFGTDIPAPTWREIEEYRAAQGEDDAGHGGGWVIATVLLALLALVAIGAMMF